MLGADAELDQVIFDGSSFGTATPAGSDEEADYLGIPGLLDAVQMRDLLSRRQEAQLDKRTAAGGTRPIVSTTHGQLRDLRKELNALVTLAHHRTGKPHGWIHNELRRLCGGPVVAAANSEQIAARIERGSANAASALRSVTLLNPYPSSGGRSATESMTWLGCIAYSSSAHRAKVSSRNFPVRTRTPVMPTT